MAINKESNGYIFGFSAVLVILVGALLATLSIVLKPFQKKNVEEEKMQNILQAIGVDVSRSEAAKEFGVYVKKQLVLNFEGKVISEDAFGVDIQKEYKSLASKEERQYPLYVCEKQGQTFYVIPLIGTGLWGPIWGFIALGEDKNTVQGAVFDHKTETPGLGAEITEASFYNQFLGKKLADAKGFVSIHVVKPGSEELGNHSVNGITGGTLTSVGVDEMLGRILGVYYRYFEANKTTMPVASEEMEQEPLNTAEYGA